MSFDKIITANKTAVTQMAYVKLGEAAIAIGIKAIRPTLPFYARGYMDHPLAKFAVGNLLALGAQQALKDNPKAQVIASAARNAAMLQLFNTVDIDAMINKLMGQVQAEAFDAPASTEDFREPVVDHGAADNHAVEAPARRTRGRE